MSCNLYERIYNCNNCGYIKDRDIKSAICIEKEGLKQVPMDCMEFKLEETLTTVFFEALSKINGIKVKKPLKKGRS